MFELIQAGANTYYFDLPSKIGVYVKNGKDAYFIDSGPHKDNAKKALRVIREKGWELKGILNTHSHADHIGGNHYLQETTGCKIFCSDGEYEFIRHPYLEPTMLYAGNPHRDLRHKFLMAAESKPVPVSDEQFPKEIEIIPLPGHSVDMVGFRTPDDIAFLADSFCSEPTLQKYGVAFYFDIEKSLLTLDAVEKLSASLFIPSHAPACEDIRPLVEKNRQKMNEVADFLWNLCKEAKTTEAVLQAVFEHYNLVMTHEQHALVGSTVRSYLSYLYDNDRLEAVFENNLQRWKSK